MSAVLGVVIPVYNAERSITAVVDGVLAQFAEMGIAGRVVLVDDGSADTSGNVIDRLCAVHGNVTGVHLAGNCGQQGALLCGLTLLADCRFCATMDDDLQHPAALLPALYEKLCAGYELVYGIPEREQRPPLRRLGSLLRDALFALCTQKPRGVRVGSFRMMTGALAQKLCAERQGYVYLSASAFRYRPKTANLFYQPRPRLYGASGYRLGGLVRVYRKLFIYYTPVGRLFLPRAAGVPYRIAYITEGGVPDEPTVDSRRFQLPAQRVDRRAKERA